MASKQVSEILVKLGIQGLEGLDKLKSSFRGLEKAIGPADSAIEIARKSIIEFSREGGESIQVIKGQIEAFKGLQVQATINGGTFRALAEDIKKYESRLKTAEAQLDSFGKKLQSQAAVESKFEKLGVSGLQGQLAKRRELLAQNTPLTESYASALGGVIQFETALTRLYERQAVVAAQAQTVKFTAARGGVQELGIPGLMEYAGVFKELPNTSAAFSQRLKELRQDLVNLDFGGEQYISTLREIIKLQKDMARAERIAQVEGQDSVLMGRQFRLEESVLAGRGRRQRIAGRVGESAAAYAADAAAFQKALQPAPIQVREISSLYQQIGDIGMAKISADIEMMGNSYEKVAADIKNATAASNGSISSLQNQRAAWSALRNQLNPASSAYKEVSKELDLIDKKLQKVEKKSRFSGRGLVQAAGAAVSGGIFGGPEGFIGGAVGAAFAGVGGAFAGAALGAQVGMLRQQAAAVAEYSAQLNLAKTTLAQASSGQEEYTRLLSTARQISSDYVVGLKETITGFAQVASAAKANNLSFKETETIYRGVIAAGVAFGKSQQDLDAIVTATVQVLSKGKLSAEELQGQIGERLPGAVAKFAEATGRTLPELSKALEQGKVPIKDFVDYTRKQVEDYDQIARIIGQSPEKAGARLKLALDTAAENYGSFFLNIGSGFQDQTAKIVSWVNTNQKEIKRLIATVILAGKDIYEIVKKTADTLAPVLKPVFQFIFDNLARGISAIRRLIQDSKNVAEAQANAQKQVELLYPNPIERALKGAQAYKEALAVEMKSLSVDPRSYTQRADDLAKQLFKEYKPSAYGAPSTTVTSGAPQGDEDASKQAAKDRKNLFQELLARIQAQNTLLTQQGRLSEIIAKTESDRAKEALKAAEEILLNQEQQLDLRFKFGEVSREVYAKEKAAIAKQGETVRAEFRKTAADIEEKADKIYRDLFEPGGKLIADNETPLEKALRGVDQVINESQKALSELGGGAAQKGLDAIKALTSQDKLGLATRSVIGEDIKTLEDEIAALQSGANTMGTLGEIMQKHRQDWDMLDAGQRKYIENLAAIKDGLRFAQDSRIGVGLREGAQQYVESIGTMREATAQLAQTGIKGVEEAIFSLVTTGTANFREFAANILRDTARMIIQQLVLRTIMQALGAIGGGGAKGGDSVSQFITGARQYSMNANGNVYAQNGIQPFAMGGIVNKPTLFKYADGGSGRFGLMGEAGPEAIIPLRRGRDGKLGVSGGGSTNNVVVNVDASGSSVQGNQPDANALGRVIGSAVQAELIKQKRPGGLLA